MKQFLAAEQMLELKKKSHPIISKFVIQIIKHGDSSCNAQQSFNKFKGQVDCDPSKAASIYSHLGGFESKKWTSSLITGVSALSWNLTKH